MYKKTSITNYYQIQSWMVNDPKLNLKYPMRDVYAILYGFTQDPNQWVEPTQAYIAELIGCTRSTVNINIKKLEELGLIIKRTEKHPQYGNKTYYQAIVPELTPCSPKQQGGVRSQNKGYKSHEQRVVHEANKGYIPREQQISKNIRKKNNKEYRNKNIENISPELSPDIQERIMKLKKDLGQEPTTSDPKPLTSVDRKRIEKLKAKLKMKYGKKNR